MRRPTRVIVYAVVGLALAYSVAIVVDRLHPCTDLDSDCDVQGLGVIIWAMIAVVVVMPVVVFVTELVAKQRGWDKISSAAPRAPRAPGS